MGDPGRCDLGSFDSIEANLVPGVGVFNSIEANLVPGVGVFNFTEANSSAGVEHFDSIELFLAGVEPKSDMVKGSILTSTWLNLASRFAHL